MYRATRIGSPAQRPERTSGNPPARCASGTTLALPWDNVMHPGKNSGAGTVGPFAVRVFNRFAWPGVGYVKAAYGRYKAVS